MSDLTTKAAEIRAGLVAGWRKAMEGVTPGPWEVAAEGTYPPSEGSKVLGPQGQNSLGYPVRYFVAQFVSERDNAWIARCSPAGISALLALIEQQAAELAEARRDTAAEEARHGRVVQGFAELCEAVGVRFDAPEAVAYEINAKIGNAIYRATTAESERDELLREKEQREASLRETIDRLHGELSAAVDRAEAAESTIASQSERIAVLEAALRPFAARIDEIEQVKAIAKFATEGTAAVKLTLLRDARSAFAPLGEE